jgi:hypothetical protein
MSFAESLGVFCCRCVLSGRKPVLAASHAGGDWQMYCNWNGHNFRDDDEMSRELQVAHVEHLVEMDCTLEELADLPVDMGAERAAPGQPWTRFEDRDE